MVFAVVLLLNAAVGVAQFQVNNAVNTRVNNPVYGGGSTGSVRYSNTSVAMPSEVRHAYWKSGAIPSEVRMNAAAIGPIPSGGSISYIPSKPSWQESRSGGSSYVPPAQGQSAFTTGSVRNATLSPNSNQLLTSPAIGSGRAGASVVTPTPGVTSVNPYASSTVSQSLSPKPTNPNATFSTGAVSGSIRHSK
jgi:hypothetical protein